MLPKALSRASGPLSLNGSLHKAFPGQQPGLTLPMAKSAGKSFLKVFLNRGFIGLPKTIRDSARAIGLTKRHQTVYLRPTPIAVGNVIKIKELVKVSLVDEKPPARTGPMYPKGYSKECVIRGLAQGPAKDYHIHHTPDPATKHTGMPRTFRIERDPYVPDHLIFASKQSAPDRSLSRSQDRDSASNAELALSNQKLQCKLQRLTTAYQAVEQQNLMLRDKCLRLQNRVDELKAYLQAIKTDVGERVEPTRLIARHLMDIAAFMEELDQSIQVTNQPESGRENSLGNIWNGIHSAGKTHSGKCCNNLDPIDETKSND